MSNETEPASQQPTLPEIADSLRRILDAVEANKRRRWVEIACALVLALASTASAWCAYQATLWSGVQTFRLAASNKASREALEQKTEAMQIRAFDAGMFITYIEARSRKDDKLSTFLHERFRPEMRKAVDAWLQTDPFNDPAAPKAPFKMAEYAQAEILNAGRHEDEAHQFLVEAEKANRNSDRYVLFTVLFALVLFFAGISATIETPRLQLAALSISLMLLIGTTALLATMPICFD